MTVFTAGIGAGSKSPDPAKELIKFLTRPEAAGRFKAKGFSQDDATSLRGSKMRDGGAALG
jgi:hypothetical protein